MTATPLRDDPADTGTQFAGLTDMQRAAASADFHMATCDAPAIADCEECRRRLSRIRTYLAAVLPEHRRMVLTEAEAAIEDARSGWPDGHTVTIGYDEAIEVVGRLAAAAPPAGLSGPVPAENAPAVPEEADGQRRSGCARCDTDQMALPCYCRRECSSDICSAMDQIPAPAPVRQARGDALTYAEMESERDRLARELYEAQMMIERLAVDDDARDGTRRAWLELEHWRTVIVPELMEQRDRLGTDRDRLAAQVEELRRYAEEHRQRLLRVREASGEPGEVSQISIRVDEADVDALRAEVRRLDHRLRWAYRHSDNDATASMLVAYELADQRDRLAAQVAHYQRVVEQVRALTITEDGHPLHPTKRVAVADITAAVDALPDVGPHQHECACNRNWGGPCGPCVCEQPPRQGVWRLVCGAENIPPNQTYATKGAAEDVMRLHGGACPGAHGVEFVPDAGTDQTEDDHA